MNQHKITTLTSHRNTLSLLLKRHQLVDNKTLPIPGSDISQLDTLKTQLTYLIIMGSPRLQVRFHIAQELGDFLVFPIELTNSIITGVQEFYSIFDVTRIPTKSGEIHSVRITQSGVTNAQRLDDIILVYLTLDVLPETRKEYVSFSPYLLGSLSELDRCLVQTLSLAYPHLKYPTK